MGEMTDAELFQVLADLRDLAELNETCQRVREIGELVERCAPVTDLLDAMGIPEEFYAQAG